VERLARESRTFRQGPLSAFFTPRRVGSSGTSASPGVRGAVASPQPGGAGGQPDGSGTGAVGATIEEVVSAPSPSKVRAAEAAAAIASSPLSAARPTVIKELDLQYRQKAAAAAAASAEEAGRRAAKRAKAAEAGRRAKGLRAEADKIAKRMEEDRKAAAEKEAAEAAAEAAAAASVEEEEDEEDEEGEDDSSEEQMVLTVAGVALPDWLSFGSPSKLQA
jgi:hypothetical protein